MSSDDKEVGLLEKQTPAKKAEGGRNPACILGGLLAFMMIGGIFCHTAVENAMREALVYTAGLGNWAAFFIFVLTAALNLLMLPTFPIMIGAGVVCTNQYHSANAGGLVGTLAVFSGLWLGSMIAFLLGRFCLQDFAKKELESHKILQVVNGMIAESGWKIVLLARMSPLLPAEVFNYACSVVPSLTPVQYGLGCLGSIVPVSFWVFSSAQATEVAQASGNGTATDAPQGGSTLIVLNVIVFVALSAAFKIAYERYKVNAEKMILRVQEPRKFVAKQAGLQKKKESDFKRTATAPVRLPSESREGDGIVYHDGQSFAERSISEELVKWNDHVIARPLADKDCCGWVEVVNEDGSQIASGKRRFLQMLCEDTPRHGMCLEGCQHHHNFLKVVNEEGPEAVLGYTPRHPPVHPRLVRLATTGKM